MLRIAGSSSSPSGSQPGSYSDVTTLSAAGGRKLRKIAVLTTDGQYNTYRGWKDSDPVTVSDNAKAICTNMKAAGVEVFTVGFDLDSLPAADRTRAEDVLQSCGSSLEHFYNTLDTAQLRSRCSSRSSIWRGRLGRRHAGDALHRPGASS